MAGKKKTKPDELGELDRAFQSIADKKATAQGMSASTVLILIACVVLLVAIAVGVWFLFSDNWFTMPDVTVAGVNMNGMTKKEAKDLLENMVSEQYGTQTMSVTVLETTLELPAKDAKIQIDVNRAINAAYESGGEFDLSPYISVNKRNLKALLDAFGTQFNAELKPTVYTVEGQVPDLTNGEEVQGQTLVLSLGTPEMGLDVEQLRADILAAYSRAEFQVTGQCSLIPPEMPTAQELYDKYLTAPVDSVMDPKTFVISPESYGYSVDPDQTEHLLKDAAYGDTLRIPFAKIAPQVTAQSLQDTLFQDILGECSTPYSGSDNNNRNTNLRLSCEKIDGMILLPGETFSYNQTLGERTKENGWKPAASYVNGLTVDTYGGGICQGSTTLYNCVLQADFKITECYPHGYISAYVPHGLDASVNWPSADFKFVNTSNWPIKLEAYRKDGKMTMRIYGTDEKDYYVKMTYADVGFTKHKTVFEEVDPANNPKGYKDGQQLVSPYDGWHIRTYKNYYDKATDQLIETKLERDFTYSVRDEVIVKFVTKTDPAPGGDGTEGEGGTTQPTEPAPQQPQDPGTE